MMNEHLARNSDIRHQRVLVDPSPEAGVRSTIWNCHAGLVATVGLLALLLCAVSRPGFTQPLILEAAATESELRFILRPSDIDSICLPGQFFSIEYDTYSHPPRWTCLYRDIATNELSVATWGDLSSEIVHIIRHPSSSDPTLLLQYGRRIVFFDPVTVTETELCEVSELEDPAHSDLQLFDRDGDGIKELANFAGTFMQVFDSSSCALLETVATLPWNGYDLVGPTALQLDSDPQDEIVAVVLNDMYVEEMHIFDGKTLEEEALFGDLSAYRFSDALDWDEDGRAELALMIGRELYLWDPDDPDNPWNLLSAPSGGYPRLVPVQWRPGGREEVAVGAAGPLMVVDPVTREVLASDGPSGPLLSPLDYDGNGQEDLLSWSWPPAGGSGELLWRQNPVGTSSLQFPFNGYSLLPGCQSLGIVVTLEHGMKRYGSGVTIRDKETLQPIAPEKIWSSPTYDLGSCGEFDAVAGPDVLFNSGWRIDMRHLDDMSSVWESYNSSDQEWLNLTVPEISCSGVGCQRAVFAKSSFGGLTGRASWILLDTTNGLPLYESPEEADWDTDFWNFFLEDVTGDGLPEIFVHAHTDGYGVPDHDEIRLFDGATLQHIWTTPPGAFGTAYSVGIDPRPGGRIAVLAGNGHAWELTAISLTDGSVDQKRELSGFQLGWWNSLTFVPKAAEGGSWVIESDQHPVAWIDASLGGQLHYGPVTSWFSVEPGGNGSFIAADERELGRYFIPNFTVWAGGFE